MTPIVCSWIPHCPKTDEKNPTSKPSVPAEPTGYALLAKNAAAAEGGLFIDLHKLIMERYAQLTPAEIKTKYFTDADDTHTNPEGAKLNAECVVEGLKQLPSHPLDAYLAK